MKLFLNFLFLFFTVIKLVYLCPCTNTHIFSFKSLSILLEEWYFLGTSIPLDSDYYVLIVYQSNASFKLLFLLFLKITF